MEIELLAGAALGWTEEETEKFIDEDGDWNSVLYTEFSVELEDFTAIANALIQLTPAMESPLTKRKYHTFGREVGFGFLAIAQVEAVEPLESK